MNDSTLIQIVDQSLADAARRSGPWLVCRPGCSQCCHGVFEITALDAQRLRAGLATLTDEPKAARIRSRLASARQHLAPWFPGDPVTGILGQDEDAIERFEEFANDDACPILDPATGTCDLYDARPILCRTFGPPIQNADEGLAVCELCFDGATEDEIAACEMDSSFRALEEDLESDYAAHHPASGQTMIAFAFPPQA